MNANKRRLTLLAVLLITLLTAILAEGLLRLFPNWYTEYGNDVYYRYNAGMLTLEPNQDTSFRHACYYIPRVRINSAGYRSYEWDNLGAERIAVLGDSFVEGKQVSENAYFAAALRKLLHVDVLNFGVSGYATIHEYLQYVREVRSYKPKVVLLFFCTLNDINGNSCKLITGGSLLSCASTENGSVVINEKQGQKKIKNLVNFLYRHYKTALFIKTVYFQHRIDPAARKKTNELPEDYYAYLPPNAAQNDNWTEAWALTEYFLKELRKETEKDNATLVLIPVVEYIRMVKNVAEEMKDAIGIDAPQGFDPKYPVKRLQEIAQKNNIVFYNPEPFFRQYRDEHNLPRPYFSYRCEGHWNPLTHYLMANLAAEYLIEKGFIEKRDSILDEIQHNLRRTPRDILGEAAYGEIYGGGFYNGPVD